MRQHEHRHVIRRLVAPPAFPAVIRPRAAHRAEHVSAEDPCADFRKTLLGGFVLDTGFAALATLHCPPRARREKPLHQFRAAHAQRLLKALVGAGGIAVEGYSEASY